MVPTVASAAPASEDLIIPELGKKTAVAQVTPGDYEITLSVPGALDTTKYSEIIVMVDASDSQKDNLDKLKANLVDIAEQVLHNDGSARLTLMGYGMGPRIVGSFYNAETLEDYLADVTQDDLLQGVSATNCEAAFEFIREYVENSEDLNKTCVIFTSDGMTNMDEVAFDLLDWDLHPEYFYKNQPISLIISYYAGGQADLMLSGGATVEATTLHYAEEATAVEIAEAQYGTGSDEHKAAVDAFYSAVTSDTEANAIAYIDDIIKDVMTDAGIDLATGASTSEYEKAFLDYEDAAFFNGYLCSIHRMVNEGAYADWYNLATWGARAADAADALCTNEKVLGLYMLDYASKKNTWMNPASTTGNQVSSDKVTYLASKDYGQAVDQIIGLSEEMFKTAYIDTTIVDPMSKWVTLDPDSIRIYENDLLIWDDGEWLYEDKQPAENPVTLTTDPTTGHSVITWTIKDGPLLYTDRYFLKYEVDVDETVEGFEYGKDYPANDPTFVNYTDENGDDQTKEIKVPDVHQPEEPDGFDAEDMGFKIYKGSSVDKSPISDITFDIYSVDVAEGDVISEKPEEAEYSKYIAAENLVGSITTDANGYAALNVTDEGYDEGIYLIVEKASDKVEAPVAPFYAFLPMTDTTTGEDINVVNIYPKNTPVEEDEYIPPVIPEDDPSEKTGKITILKHLAGNEEKVLAGAEFQVYELAKDGEEAVITTTYCGQEIGLVPVASADGGVFLTTDETGYATSTELEYGLYFLLETDAPLGCIALEEPVAAWVNVESVSANNAVLIPNEYLNILPATGGMGTTLFIVGGCVIIAAAASVLVLSRRKSTAN